MPSDADRPLPATQSARARVLRCAACGRAEPHTTAELRRLARTRWPECCGEPMPVAPDSESPFAEALKDRRSGRRRLGRSGVRAEVRRGPLGMGPNLADGLIEVSEAGARVRLKLAVPVG
ncbi:MAG: hypothetical protein J2P46_16835, partial [Zavarzinella sp.]|nr:hypothetical protein [Zavarzinella sp.]